MQNYVHRGGDSRRKHDGNRPPKTSRLFDDLKHNAPNPDGKRASDLGANKASKVDNTFSGDSNQAQPFYATDLGSSIASPTVEAVRRNSFDDFVAQTGYDAVDANRQNIDQYPDDKFLDSQPEEINEPHNPQGHDEQVGEEESQKHSQRYLISSQLGAHDNGFSNKYISGDSFPDTTSGRLSTVDGEAMREQYRHFETRPINYRHYNGAPPNRTAAVESMPNNGPGVREASGYLQTDPFQHSNQITHRGSPENFEQVILSAAMPPQSPTGFKFAPHARKPTSTMQPPKPQSFPLSSATHLQHALPQRGASGYNAPVQTIYNPQQPKSAKAKATADIQGIHDMVKRGKTPVPIVNQQVEPEQHNDTDYQRFNGKPNDFLNGTTSDETNEELFHMDYETLKSHSFNLEKEPRKATESSDESMPLSRRLEFVLKMPIEDQRNFFDSLPNEGWEETGDWFIDRFGDLVGKMKAARQARRDAAQNFAAEIDQRHEMVARKREQTEDALAEMKESGARVLQGTPKGRKTT